MIDGQPFAPVRVFSPEISVESRALRVLHAAARFVYRLLAGPF
jgi:hypothetical protein